jgi:hypothetical protein
MERDLDFIYVGLPKAGSTWLFEALREHPGARVLASKSSKFFESDAPGSLADYRKLLARLEPGGLAGEISHDAYMYDNTAPRLHEAFPDVRILACLREPGDFAQSVLTWWTTHTREFGNCPREMVTHSHFRAAVDQLSRLQAFYELFPRERIKVVLFDDLVANPNAFYDEICGFLGLSNEYRPACLSSVVNMARPPRYPLLTRAIYRTGDVVRNAGFGDLVERAKRSPTLDTLLYMPSASPSDPEIVREAEKIRKAARPNLDRLEDLIGRPVPPAWREA